MTTTLPARRKIILDTDPGQDDAIAILVALVSPELEVLGITTVAGNVPLPLTLSNTRKLCELADQPTTPVFEGCARPMVRELVTAEHVHGKTGLDGPDLPEPTMAVQPEHAVDFIIDTLLGAEDGEITLCPVGPLTNVAMAMVKEPTIVPKIREIVLMGGAYWEGGNITPTAEFNIYVDPHAAHVVFTSGVPIVAHSLDVTHRALMTKEWIAAVRNLGTPVGVASAEMLTFYERFDEEKYGTNGGPLHDPNVIAYLLDPSIYDGKDCFVEVETGSEKTMGQTSVDWWGVTKNAPNCRWIREVDTDRFYALLLERLGRY